jgi:hypothetical protein
MFKMKITTKMPEVDIEKIKPDPNQPRSYIDELELREMAQSIVTEGIINPIEIDEKFMIITGERRWRAAKLAGLKTVPVKVLEISKEERFLRQMVENLHNDSMAYADTAKGLKKLINIAFSPGEKPFSPRSGPTKEIGISWLHEKTGKSFGYIDEHLTYLEMDKTLQKGVEKGEIEQSMVRVIQRTPEEYKKKIQEKVLKGEFKTRGGALELVSAIKREIENPHVIKKLLEKDYSKYTGAAEMHEAVAKISPRLTDILEKSQIPSVEIGKISEKLGEWVKDNPRSKVGKFFEPKIVVNMNFMKITIDKWLKGDDEDQKLLENGRK